MICLAGNLPALQVGQHQVAGYELGWIDESLRRAAFASEQGDCPFLKEVSHAVCYYLENHCSLKVLPLTELFERMQRMLRKIGFEKIAQNLSPLAPKMQVSLAKLAQGYHSPDDFFLALEETILELKDHGAEEVTFCDLHHCLNVLGDEQEHQILAQRIHHFLKHFQGIRLSAPSPQSPLSS